MEVVNSKNKNIKGGGHDQIPVLVHVRWLFYFTKYLPENLENTSEDGRKRLSTLFE